MELEQLEILVEVVRAGSFAAVARARSVDPSSVSRAISSLESELDLRLLHRTTRTLLLTEVGRRYLDQVRPLVAGLRDAAREAADGQRMLSGTVSGTVPTSFAQACIVPQLPVLRQLFPQVQLHLRITDERVNLLDSGLDFALRLGRVLDPDLVSRRVRTVVYRCVASHEYLARHPAPKCPMDLSNHEALRFPLADVGPVWRFRDARAVVTEVPLSGPLVLSNTLALRDAARAGLGVCVLPDWLIGADLARGDLTALLPELEVTLSTFDAGVFLVFPTRRYIPARVRAVTDQLVRVIRDTAAS